MARWYENLPFEKERIIERPLLKENLFSARL